jgi:hypothetical protein
MDLTALTAAFRRVTFADTGIYTDADVKDSLNEGLRMIYSVDRWPFLSKEVDFNTSTSTHEYRIGSGQVINVSDMMYFGSVYKKNSSDNPLDLVSFDNARLLYGDGTGISAGSPQAATLFTRAALNYLALFPRPTVVEAFVFQYYYIPADLSAGIDVPQWDYAFHHILVDWAAYRFYTTIQEQQNAREHLKLFQGGVSDLKAYYNKRAGSGPIIFGDGMQSNKVATNLGSLLI